MGQAGWQPGGSPAPSGGRRRLHIPVAMLGICVIVLWSMIHQKVLRERSGVSGFLIYQLAIPGLRICQPSLSWPGALPPPLLLLRLYWRRLTESSLCCFVLRFLVCKGPSL